jgi:hypothetical protein
MLFFHERALKRPGTALKNNGRSLDSWFLCLTVNLSRVPERFFWGMQHGLAHDLYLDDDLIPDDDFAQSEKRPLKRAKVVSHPATRASACGGDPGFGGISARMGSQWKKVISSLAGFMPTAGIPRAEWARFLI